MFEFSDRVELFLQAVEKELGVEVFGDWREIGTNTLTLSLPESGGDAWVVTVKAYDPNRMAEENAFEMSLSVVPGAVSSLVRGSIRYHIPPEGMNNGIEHFYLLTAERLRDSTGGRFGDTTYRNTEAVFDRIIADYNARREESE